MTFNDSAVNIDYSVPLIVLLGWMTNQFNNMPRPSNTTIRKKQIIEALMAVMASSGYAGATIPLIAKQAGLSTGLLHYHFDSKQSMLLALVHHLSEVVDARIQSLKGEEPVSHLLAYIDAHLAIGLDSNQMAVSCWINIGAESISQMEVRQAYQQATKHQISILESICNEALHALGRSTIKKREIALGIIAAIEGCYRLLISAPDMIPTGFAATTVKAMALGLLNAQPKAHRHRRI